MVVTVGMSPMRVVRGATQLATSSASSLPSARPGCGRGGSSWPKVLLDRSCSESSMVT
ncbi:hypothetical protein [Leucobacter soli]|uniref:hypothetical protein n=1 Tax=Leucobacter soli TaxID=2812850 RepID=UPI00361EB334